MQFFAFRRVALVATLPLAVAACSPYAGPGEYTGTYTGAVVGGLIGSTIGHGAGRVAATAIGATAGGLIGNRIGATIDRDAAQRAYEAEMWALENSPPGRPYRWSQGEYYGYVEAGPTYAYGGQSHCRQYTQTIYVGGQPQKAQATACKMPDGTWQQVG